VRLGFALIQTYTGLDLPGGGVGSDAINFENHGWKNAQYWLQGGVPGRMTGAHYYSAWIGILYYIFGRVPLVPQVFNIYFSLATIYLVYYTTFSVINDKRTARIAAIIFAIIPTLNFYAAILLRETLIILFMFASFYCEIFRIKPVRDASFVNLI